MVLMLGFPTTEEDDLQRWLDEQAPPVALVDAGRSAPNESVDTARRTAATPAPAPNESVVTAPESEWHPEFKAFVDAARRTAATPAPAPRPDYALPLTGRVSPALERTTIESRTPSTPELVQDLRRGTMREDPLGRERPLNATELGMLPEGFRAIATPDKNRPAVAPPTDGQNGADMASWRDLVTGAPQSRRGGPYPDESGRGRAASGGGGGRPDIDPGTALAAFGALMGSVPLASAGAILAKGEPARGDGMSEYQRAQVDLANQRMGRDDAREGAEAQREAATARQKAERDARRRDPTSAENRRMQAFIAAQTGADPADLEGLTAEDYDAYGSDMVKAILEQKRNDRERREQEARDAAQHARNLERDRVRPRTPRAQPLAPGDPGGPKGYKAPGGIGDFKARFAK